MTVSVSAYVLASSSPAGCSICAALVYSFLVSSSGWVGARERLKLVLSSDSITSLALRFYSTAVSS